jgi:hypothetical protein
MADRSFTGSSEKKTTQSLYPAVEMARYAVSIRVSARKLRP